MRTLPGNLLHQYESNQCHNFKTSGLVVEEQMNLSHHRWNVSSLQFSSNGLYFASGGWDKTVNIWDLRKLEKPNIMGTDKKGDSHSAEVTCLSWFPHIEFFLCSGSADKSLIIWNTDSGEALAKLIEHKSWVLGSTFTADGNYLASSSWDGTVMLWDMNTLCPISELTGHSAGVWSCCFSKNSSDPLLCTASEDYSLRLWDKRLDQRWHSEVVLSGVHQGPIKCCDWSNCGNYLAAGSEDKKISLWDIRVHKVIKILNGHTNDVMDVKFHPTSNSLLCSVGDTKCCLWDCFNARHITSLEQHSWSCEVECLALSPDGTLFATGSVDKNIVLSTIDVEEDFLKQNNEKTIVKTRATSKVSIRVRSASTVTSTATIASSSANLVDTQEKSKQGNSDQFKHTVHIRSAASSDFLQDKIIEMKNTTAVKNNNELRNAFLTASLSIPSTPIEEGSIRFKSKELLETRRNLRVINTQDIVHPEPSVSELHVRMRQMSISENEIPRSHFESQTPCIQSKMSEMEKRSSYFHFLLDNSGEVLKNYLDSENKEPPPLDLCKLFIEKSLAVATTAALGATENQLKVFEAQRIWQPLCLAMTLISHLKWDLDVIQKNIPLHLQQILMEELLKGYTIPQILLHDIKCLLNEIELDAVNVVVISAFILLFPTKKAPKPEDFDVNKLDKRSAMVHILYNRWVVRTITKYEELKEKDIKLANISLNVKEAKESQEEQIFQKVKEYRNLSVDILEKAILLENDIEVPFPKPRWVTSNEVIPYSEAAKDEKPGVLMKVPETLDIQIAVQKPEIVFKMCIDLGCYYFPKELFHDAWRMFQKAMQLLEEHGSLLKEKIPADQLSCYHGYFNACSCMVNKKPLHVESCTLLSRLEESSRNAYQDVVAILKDDIESRVISSNKRENIENKLYLLGEYDLLFSVCILNFIQCCLDERVVSQSFLQSLNRLSKKELEVFMVTCIESYKKLQNDDLKEKLVNGLRLCERNFSDENKNELLCNKAWHQLFTKTCFQQEPVNKKQKEDSLPQVHHKEKAIFTDSKVDDRISSMGQLKANLISCFDPEELKDILFALHELSPDQSHAVGYECQMYEEIFLEVRDLLMKDTVHICVAKGRQLCSMKKFKSALAVLNICLETLVSYATRSSPGCSVARVKNILHHELLWTELKFSQYDPENANPLEALRRCKACVHHRNQEPPPSAHIYEAITVFLLNHKEHEFLTDVGATVDSQVVDFLQLGFHLSSVVCGLQRGIEVLRNAAKRLWEAILNIIMEGDVEQLRSAEQEDLFICNRLQCYVTKDDLLSMIHSIECHLTVFSLFTSKEDTILSLLLSCLTSVFCSCKEDLQIKDSNTHLWPAVKFSTNPTNSKKVLTILKPLLTCCLKRNPRNIAWLRTIGDVYLVENDFREAMKCYLELGSITTSFFSRSVSYSVWDDKVYKNMVQCCEQEKAYTLAMILCQFTDPVDYTTAFKAAQQRTCLDGGDSFYDCFWNINILEYLTYAHDKRGEIEKRKLAVRTLSQPELNCRGSPEILEQSSEIRKTRFLRALTRLYWT